LSRPDETAEDPVVLVADDDATTRYLLKEALEKEGLRIEEAADKWLADNESKWRGWIEGSGS